MFLGVDVSITVLDISEFISSVKLGRGGNGGSHGDGGSIGGICTSSYGHSGGYSSICASHGMKPWVGNVLCLGGGHAGGEKNL